MFVVRCVPFVACWLLYVACCFGVVRCVGCLLFAIIVVVCGLLSADCCGVCL